MSSLTKKLVLSVLTLIITVGAFSATTFAWFTLSNVAQTGAVTAELTAGDGLEIQIKSSYVIDNEIVNLETPWLSNITPTMMQSIVVPQEGLALNALTSVDGKVLSPVTIGQVTTPTAVAGKNYIEFTINFRSAEAGVINLSNSVISSKGVDVKHEIGFVSSLSGNVEQLGVEEAPYKFYAANALRISFVEGTAVRGVLENAAGVPVDASALTNAEKATLNTLGAGSNLKGAHSYYNALMGSNVITGAENPTVAAATVAGAAVGSIATLSDTGDYHTGSVVVRVWVEGWDYEAYNMILRDVISFNLEFTKA